MPVDPWEVHEQLELFPEPGAPRRSPVQLSAPHRGLLPRQVGPVDADPVVDAALESALARLQPGRRVKILYTNNRTVILSLRPDREGLPVLRAHQCFRNAPKKIAEAAIRLYLTKARPAERRRYSHLVTCWHQDTAAPPKTLATNELRNGEHHDLRKMFDHVNATWFASELRLDITFGDRIARRLMGRHERRSPHNLIILNPLLDHPWVTSWYMEFLTFHECLHEVHPPRPEGQRMILHPPAFRDREKQHPDFSRARKYERWITETAFGKLHKEALKRSRG